MADSLKAFFSPALVKRLADDIERVHPSFPSRAFIRDATRGLETQELLDRGKHITKALEKHLPASYPDAIDILASAFGGGLTAGVALALKAKVPQAQIYTAEPAGFDDFVRSLHSGKREQNPSPSGTICDGLMTGTPGEITFAVNRKLVTEGVTLTDKEVGAAVAFAFRELKLVVEPSGAISLAALLTGKIDVRGKVAVAVLSGGNVDPALFNQLVA